jgi:hypothetical protein
VAAAGGDTRGKRRKYSSSPRAVDSLHAGIAASRAARTRHPEPFIELDHDDLPGASRSRRGVNGGRIHDQVHAGRARTPASREDTHWRSTAPSRASRGFSVLAQRTGSR